jgi:hypothetical protein
MSQEQVHGLMSQDPAMQGLISQEQIQRWIDIT